jgi:phosphoglycerate dehydrogenase-like enzyme
MAERTAASRRPGAAGRATILVYYPGGTEAERYARLIRAPRGRVTVHTAATPEAAALRAAEADVFYGWKFPPTLLAKAGRLRWLQAMGAGVDWALRPELPPGVTVTRAPGVFAPWMREYALGWLLWITQRTETYRALQRERRWDQRVAPHRLAGATLAVVGLGDIGRTIARAARAFGMHVVGVSRHGRGAREADRVYRPAQLTRALGEADFVVVVTPLTEETRGLIDARALAAMRPTAWLMNIGRGPVVDERALMAALDERRIAGAILDVFATEPLPPESPWWRYDNVAVTPHIAGPDVPEDMAPLFNDNLARYLGGRPLRHVVDRRRGY